jgi:hypothetical protein
MYKWENALGRLPPEALDAQRPRENLSALEQLHLMRVLSKIPGKKQSKQKQASLTYFLSYLEI